MTLTADAKKRVVLPGAVPGDVFTCEKISQGMLLRRIYRQKAKKKMTKKQVLAAVRRWKYIPAMSWESFVRSPASRDLVLRKVICYELIVIRSETRGLTAVCAVG